MFAPQKYPKNPGVYASASLRSPIKAGIIIFRLYGFDIGGRLRYQDSGLGILLAV